MSALPDVSEAAVGVNKTAALMPKIKNAINYAYARAVSPLISQAWPDGDLVLSFGTGSTYSGVLQWRVPCLGFDHKQYTITLVAKTDQAVGGSVRVENGGGTSVQHQFVTGGANPAAGAEQTVILTLAVNGDGNAEYDTITLKALCSPTVPVTLMSIDVHIAAVASPLTPGMRAPGGGFVQHQSRESRGALHPLGGPDFAAIGGNVTATGHPMSAALGRYIIDDLHHVDSRQKAAQCFSAFHKSITYASAVIQVTDFAQIVHNSTITLVDAGGVNHVFTFKANSVATTANQVGIQGAGNNSDVATQIKAALNDSTSTVANAISVSGFSAPKVVIMQQQAGAGGNQLNTGIVGVVVNDFAGGIPDMRSEHSDCLLPAVTLNREPGAFPGGNKVIVHVRARNTSADDAFVLVDVFDVAGFPPVARNFGSFNGGFCRITVPAGANGIWFKKILTISDHGGGTQGAGTTPVLNVGVLNAEAAGVGDDVPLAEVSAWSVWGDV
jgi:hypothetical protein